MTFFRRVHLSFDHPYFRAGVGIALIALLALPLWRGLLESSLINHMLVQIPLLALAGWLIARGIFSSRFFKWNERGIPGLLIAVFAMLFWMIPRWLDAALSEPLWEATKFITVPLLIGAPLGISWPRMSPFSRAVVWTNAISMLVVIGWLYVAAPVRVCNNYLVNQQEAFGFTAMMVALAIALYWIGVVFFGKWEKAE
ncbi:hypothetical protein ACFL4M_00780 [Pseudomonadota bacterium]